MPGSEFRSLPRLPLEFKTYKVIKPANIGRAMTQGWTPVAAINFEEMIDGASYHTTRFLIGKGAKRVQSMPGAGPTPVVMYPQPDGEEEAPADSGQLQQLLDRISVMSQEEVLALHAELVEQRQAAASEEDDEEEDAAVTEAMEELLADDEDDGTEDDDE